MIEIEEKEPKVFDNEPKEITIDDAKRYYNAKYLNNGEVYDTDIEDVIKAGIKGFTGSLKKLPTELRMAGGQALYASGEQMKENAEYRAAVYPKGNMIFNGNLGVKLGDKLMESGKYNIITANRNLETLNREIEADMPHLSAEDRNSWTMMIAEQGLDYGVMLGLSYINPVLGMGYMGTKIFGQETEEGAEAYKKKFGTIEGFEKLSGDELTLNVGNVAVQEVFERAFGAPAQLKRFKTMKDFSRAFFTGFGEEFLTENLQNVSDAVFDHIGKRLEEDETILTRIQDNFKGTLVAGLFGGTAGTAFAISNRAKGISDFEQLLEGSDVPVEDRNTLATDLYESGVNNLQEIITKELELNSQLRAKHGQLYDNLKKQIDRQVRATGAFQGKSESEIAQYLEGTAKQFADNVLAEAQLRNSLIDDVVNKNDIVYEKGRLRLAPKLTSPRERTYNPERMSLLTYLKYKGGLKDVGGDLKAMDAGKQVIGLINNKSGRSLDDAAMDAWESGYFPQFPERPSVNDLLNAISDSLGGRKIYRESYRQRIKQKEDRNKATIAQGELDDFLSDFFSQEDIDSMSQDDKQRFYSEIQEQSNAVSEDEYIDQEYNALTEDEQERYSLMRENGATHEEAIDEIRARRDPYDAVERRHKLQEAIEKQKQAYADFEAGKISMEELNKADEELKKANREFYGDGLFELYQESMDIAEENARLDDIYPAYEGETININGQEKTVYNSNGDRIAKSKEALENFYRWFGDSKVVDEQGRPLVVYHGTSAEFSVFDKSKQKGSSYYGKGFYFTNWSDVSTYGKIKMPLYLNIKNPLIIKEGDVSSLKAAEDIIGAHPDMPDEQKEWDFEGWAKYTLGYRSDIEGNIESVLSSKGYDGVIILDTENDGQRNKYIAFNPNQIKSTSNRGTYSESENIYYQAGEEEYRAEHQQIQALKGGLESWEKRLEQDKQNPYNLDERAVDANIRFDKREIARIKKQIKELESSLKEPLEEKLYATHNMSLEGVKGALRLGGMAMPSLAMRRVSQGNINQFGDIVFVADKNLASPSRTTRVYDRDAWTPSIAMQLKYHLSPRANSFIRQVLDKAGQSMRASTFRYNIEDNIGSPSRDSVAQELYEIDKGLDETKYRGDDEEYLDWYEEHFSDSEPYLWTENDSQTDMIERKFTLPNIMKILKRQDASGGGWLGDSVWDLSHTLQWFAKDLRSMKELKANKDRIRTREEQSEYLNKINNTFWELADELAKDGVDYGYGGARQALAIVLVNEDGTVRERLEKEKLDSSDDAVKKVESLIDDMKNAITDYFEVKPRRVVNFDEFAGVVVPDGKEYDDVARQLGYKGLKVERVEKGNADQYKDAMMNIYREKPDVFFQSAFAGSRVDYDRPSLEAIGSGEGNQAHGWGLYYALNRDVAEGYRDSFVADAGEGIVQYNGVIFNQNSEYADFLLQLKRDKRGAIARQKTLAKFFKDNGNKELADKHKALAKDAENINVDDIKAIGQVHEVDIPENPYLLDENKNYNNQSDFVKEKLKEFFKDKQVLDLIKQANGKYAKSKIKFFFENTSEDYSKVRELNELLFGTKTSETTPENARLLSELLHKHGIKGITYEGRQDGRCFVIFNPADVKVIQKFYQKGKKIKGAFDKLTKSIKITKDADFSTYQHEFAHFWLDNIWDYVNSGQASADYLKRFDAIKKWLDVKPNQSYFTRAQHEKFARGYEKFLYQGKAVNPIIASAFDDYDKFIRDVYDDITEIDTRANEKYEPLTREAYNFFNSMVSGELTPPANLPDETIEQARQTVEKSETDAKEVVAEESKVLEENRANYKLEPVKTDTKTSYLSAYEKMTGEKVEAGVAELDKEMAKANEFVANNLELAEKIVNGEAPAPENMLKNTIYLAYQEMQKKLGNTEKRANALLNQAQELRAYGQEIASQKLAYADQSTPLYWLSRVMSARAESIAEGNKMTASELQDYINNEIKGTEGDEKAVDKAVKTLAENLGIRELYQTEKVDLSTKDGVYKYVTSKLGITPTQEQTAEIVKRADDMLNNLNNAQTNGNPTVDYFVKYKDLENYANSIAPSNRLRVLVSVVGKGNLLASFKSPNTNIVANLPVAALQASLRRQKLGVAKSIVDPELIKQNKKQSWEIYRKTGYQLNNMTDVSPKGLTLGEKITHSQGEGLIRKIGRIYENVIYKWSLGAPDLKFKDFAFNDYVALAATKESGGNVAKANEIYKDAAKIMPQTELGQRIRQEAIEDSLVSTYQNNGKISESALKIRKSMDFGVGFGEFIAPFVKTPANVVGMGLDTAFGGVRALTSEIIRDVKAGKVLTPKSENVRLVVQNGLGLLVASLLLGAIDDDDYMPSYALATNKDKQLAKELNIPYNSIRIGDTWYSMDYLGPLASPVMGLLQARREDGIINSVMGYVKSGAIQTLSIPAFGNVGDLNEKIQNVVRKDGVDALEDIGSQVIEATIARSVPSIVSDIAKVLDENDREAKTLKEKLQAKTPILREKLPEKYNVTTGKVMPRSENTIKRVLIDLFAGARVKEQVVNDMADELFRLNSKGYGVGLTDITRSGLLSTVDSDKKALVKKDFAQMYSKGVQDLIKTYRYRHADDEDKKDMIDSLRRKYVNELKKKYLKKNKR